MVLLKRRVVNRPCPNYLLWAAHRRSMGGATTTSEMNLLAQQQDPPAVCAISDSKGVWPERRRQGAAFWGYRAPLLRSILVTAVSGLLGLSCATLEKHPGVYSDCR